MSILATAQAANNVAQTVTYSATGASAVTGNHFGCAHSSFLLSPCPIPLANTLTVTPAGQQAQLGCVKHVFTDGFTVAITNEKTKAVTRCSVAGASGACGPAGVNVKVDLTGGTGKAPAASGPAGTTTLTPAELSSKPIARRQEKYRMVQERENDLVEEELAEAEADV